MRLGRDIRGEKGPTFHWPPTAKVLGNFLPSSEKEGSARKQTLFMLTDGERSARGARAQTRLIIMGLQSDNVCR